MPFTYMSRNRANPGQRYLVTVMDGGSDPSHNIVVTSPTPWRHFRPSTWDACTTNPFTSNGLLFRLYLSSTLIQQFAKFSFNKEIVVGSYSHHTLTMWAISPKNGETSDVLA